MRKCLAKFCVMAIISLTTVVGVRTADSYEPIYVREHIQQLAHATEQAAMAEFPATEAELARVKKLVCERVAEAKKLRIFEKADTIVEVLTKSGKTDFFDTGIHISRETRSEENTVKIVIYDNLGYKVFQGFKSHNGLLQIEAYKPGSWQKQVDLFYTNTQKIKINDLKKRYGIR